jgi:predicted nucleic-acid-binding Zn-ribbon protein
MPLGQENKLGAKKMTNSWQCDKCGRHFISTEKRIELARKLPNGPSYEYIPYQDMCTDCELYDKKMSEKHKLRRKLN